MPDKQSMAAMYLLLRDDDRRNVLCVPQRLATCSSLDSTVASLCAMVTPPTLAGLSEELEAVFDRTAAKWLNRKSSTSQLGISKPAFSKAELRALLDETRAGNAERP